MKHIEFLLSAGATAVVVIADYLFVVTDCVVAGRVLGEMQLAAMNFLMPAFSLVTFLAWILSFGTAEAYARANKRGKTGEASILVGQGFALSILVGIVCIVLGILLEKPYYAFLGVSGQICVYAHEFWLWYQLVIPLQAAYMMLCYLLFKRGKEIAVIASFVTAMVVNAACSYLLCERFGMSGISLGTVLALFAALFILLPWSRFLVARLPLSRMLDLSALFRPLRLSLPHSYGWLFQAALFLGIVKYVTYFWDIESLAVCAVVFCIIRLSGFLGGLSLAMRPHEAKRTNKSAAVRRLYHIGETLTLALLTMVTAIFFIAPELIAGLFGIENLELVEGSRMAVRETITILILSCLAAYVPSLRRSIKESSFVSAPLNYLQGYILERVEEDPTSRMFNLAKFFRVRKGVDLRKLADALTASARTHSALWSTLAQDADGEIVQRKSLPYESFKFPIYKTTEEELFADLPSIVKTFNAFGGRLFDAAIYDCGDNAYLLSNFHHLVCDGYSFPVILEDAHKIFNGETLSEDTYYEILKRRAEKSSTPFAEASRTMLRETMKAKDYVTLPKPDLAGESGYGAEEFPLELPASFNDFLAAHRVTRHHVFLAATVLALKEITGANDVLVDWVFHGRLSKDELKTVGAFMVDLPLVVDGEEEFTNDELLTHIKRSTFNGIKNVNIIRDVSDCNPEGEERLTFIYQDEWGELMSPGPVRENGPYAWMIEETIPLSAPSAATENPFNVEIMEHDGSTKLFIEYDSGLYSKELVVKYAELFKKAVLSYFT